MTDGSELWFIRRGRLLTFGFGNSAVGVLRDYLLLFLHRAVAADLRVFSSRNFAIASNREQGDRDGGGQCQQYSFLVLHCVASICSFLSSQNFPESRQTGVIDGNLREEGLGPMGQNPFQTEKKLKGGCRAKWV